MKTRDTSVGVCLWGIAHVVVVCWRSEAPGGAIHPGGSFNYPLSLRGMAGSSDTGDPDALARRQFS